MKIPRNLLPKTSDERKELAVLLLVGSFPVFPYSQGWGYYPSGGLLLLIVIVFLLMNRGV
jgi:hypothetical protein